MGYFQVSVEPSGVSFTVNQGEVILDAALRQNINLLYGCRSGSCGTCNSIIKKGSVTYPEGEPPTMPQESGACLICQAVAEEDLVIEAEVLESVSEITPKTLSVKVIEHKQLAHDVMQIKLKLPEGERLQFLAGQYLNIIMDNGERRAFSIANAPHDDEFIELHIRHVEGGKFTDFVFSSLRDKALLRIEAPLGTFTLREDSKRPILMIAGGTGFAPIKGMIEHAIYAGITRAIKLYWGVRAKRDFYMPGLAKKLAQQQNIEIIPVYSEPDESTKGYKGFVHEIVIDHIGEHIKDYDVYMAGPPVMIEAASLAFEKLGLNQEYIFSDAFEYAHPQENEK